MAQSIREFEKSYTSTNDLSTYLYHIVQVDTSNDNSIVLATASTDPIVGVLQDEPVAGAAGLVRHIGTTKVVCGGTVTRGDRVTSNASGQAITTITNKDSVVGIALDSGVTGDIIEVLLAIGTLSA